MQNAIKNLKQQCEILHCKVINATIKSIKLDSPYGIYLNLHYALLNHTIACHHSHSSLREIKCKRPIVHTIMIKYKKVAHKNISIGCLRISHCFVSIVSLSRTVWHVLSRRVT
jgi:hypothetical protein